MLLSHCMLFLTFVTLAESMVKRKMNTEQLSRPKAGHTKYQLVTPVIRLSHVRCDLVTVGIMVHWIPDISSKLGPGKN